MLIIRRTTLQRVLTCLAGLLVLKVTSGVVLNYRNYFPPNFESDFLQGREGYFSGSYQWAFYTHLVAGPLSLILGTILISERFRLRFPKWHRSLGRMQGMGVLFLLAPSGLWMAFRAEGGPIAVVGFAALAIVTGISVAMGWRLAVKRRFADHRRWMWRCYLLLCSAVVLRLIVGLTTVTGIQGGWVDPAVAWVSWLVPLLAFELSDRVRRFFAQPVRMTARSSHQKSSTFSPPAIEISPLRLAAGNETETNRTAPSPSTAYVPPV